MSDAELLEAKQEAVTVVNDGPFLSDAPLSTGSRATPTAPNRFTGLGNGIGDQCKGDASRLRLPVESTVNIAEQLPEFEASVNAAGNKAEVVRRARGLLGQIGVAIDVHDGTDFSDIPNSAVHKQILDERYDLYDMSATPQQLVEFRQRIVGIARFLAHENPALARLAGRIVLTGSHKQNAQVKGEFIGFDPANLDDNLTAFHVDSFPNGDAAAGGVAHEAAHGGLDHIRSTTGEQRLTLPIPEGFVYFADSGLDWNRYYNTYAKDVVDSGSQTAFSSLYATTDAGEHAAELASTLAIGRANAAPIMLPHDAFPVGLYGPEFAASVSHVLACLEVMAPGSVRDRINENPNTTFAKKREIIQFYRLPVPEQVELIGTFACIYYLYPQNPEVCTA